MRRRGYDDAGQAAPVYITVIGALLFLAFAYFAVGQAAATRNGAETAADAAALAAAQDARDQLRGHLLDILGGGGALGAIGDVLGGHWPGLQDSCGAADRFAAANKAHVTSGGCTPVAAPRQGYTVSVESDDTVGRSVIPGTETTRAHATATAVIEPLCSWQSASSSPSPSTLPAGPGPSATPGPSASAPPGPAPGTLVCGGRSWVIDPANLALFPSAAELFSVHLTS